MGLIGTAEQFKEFVAAIEAVPGYRQPVGFGLCRVDCGQADAAKILACSFPVINWKENFGSAAVFQHAAGLTEQPPHGPEHVTAVTAAFLGAALEAFAPFVPEAVDDRHHNVQMIKSLDALVRYDIAKLSDFRLVFVYEDAPPQSVPSAYLKLFALAAGKTAESDLNLQGLADLLQPVAWVAGKPVELGYLREREIEMRLAGTYPVVDCIDYLPRHLRQALPQGLLPAPIPG